MVRKQLPSRRPTGVESFSLAVIGSGSGSVLVPDGDDGRRIALIEMRAFGGTCINRGCIPSKMLALVTHPWVP